MAPLSSSFHKTFFMLVYQTLLHFDSSNKDFSIFYKVLKFSCCFTYSKYFWRHCWVKHFMRIIAWFIWHLDYIKIKTVLCFVKFCMKSKNLYLKANHLAYIELRCYGSWVFADCQQNFLLSKHDTSGRFLLVTFLDKQKRERTARKW